MTAPLIYLSKHLAPNIARHMYSWKIAESDLLGTHILIFIEGMQEDVFGPGKASTQACTHSTHACKHVYTNV